MNRLTITLDDDLYAMVRSHAVATKTSISKSVGMLLRRQQAGPANKDAQVNPEATAYFDPVLGFQVSRSLPITLEDIQRATDDEDVRHLEAMGLSAEKIEHRQNP
jgi:hypothetical protein